jgi:competence ComEA-like helix-hairpin-helix protein
MKSIRLITATVFFMLAAGLTAYAADPGSTMQSSSSAGVINVNTASQDQLKMLPLIDDKMAANIIDYRNSNGPFKSLDDIMNVSGMSKAKFDQIRPYLVLSGDTTFNPSMFKEKGSSKNPMY